ncbi:gamma-butyrobetaine hydroxylase-like domain-containing protein [Zavarzinia sp. CC-PAN008]|uniref:gamma-butyrobetaine hydroxylase-like domain-containing protein n=1 Tax=Zavarzinia sp. CC-PAN008 TaxID=3243332 RepID=UPI003F749D97
MTLAKPWPLELRLLKAERALEVDWDDGETHRLSAELLRVESPSAEVQGHGGGPRMLSGGKRHVGIIALHPVGHYAVLIQFDDGHDTGIFSWSYLRELGENRDILWQRYIKDMAAQGLSRD